MQEDKAERAQYEARRSEFRRNQANIIRKRFQSTTQKATPKPPISINSKLKKTKVPLQPFFLGGIPKDEFLKGLQKSLAKMPLDLSPHTCLKN